MRLRSCRARAARTPGREAPASDDRGGLEVNRNFALDATKGSREEAGENSCNHTVEVGRARPRGDEREHVQAAVHNGLPAALEERSAASEDHGCREREIHPISQRSRGTGLLIPATSSAMPSNKIGAVRARQAQKRRLMV